MRATMPLAPDSKKDVAALRRGAREALATSLSFAPANPYVWIRLTLLSEQDGDPPEKSLSYWRYSVVTGPQEDRIRFIRTTLGLPLWSYMDVKDRESLFEDIRNDFVPQSSEFVTLARDPFARAVIRSALITDLPKLKRFEMELAHELGS